MSGLADGRCIQTVQLEQVPCGAGAAELVLHAHAADRGGQLLAQDSADSLAQTADDAVLLGGDDLAALLGGLEDDLLVQRLDGVDVDDPGVDALGSQLLGSQAGRAIPWRFPVLGGHGEQRLQLPGRHRDAARDFPLPNGAEALIGHLLHRIFIRRVVEDSLHLVEVLCTGHNIDHPSARAQHTPELFLCKGREAVEQQVGPFGADRLGKAGCHRVFCGRQCLCGQTHRRLCDIKARQLHRPSGLCKGLCNAAVVPAFAAARIQQVERCICPGGSAVCKAQFPSALPKMP